MYLRFVYNSDMGRREGQFKKPVTGREKTCSGDQDPSLELDPHSPRWREAASVASGTVVLRPEVYREGADSFIDRIVTRQRQIGHGAVDGSNIDLELITPLFELEAS